MSDNTLAETDYKGNRRIGFTVLINRHIYTCTYYFSIIMCTVNSHHYSFIGKLWWDIEFIVVPRPSHKVP